MDLNDRITAAVEAIKKYLTMTATDCNERVEKFLRGNDDVVSLSEIDGIDMFDPMSAFADLEPEQTKEVQEELLRRINPFLGDSALGLGIVLSIQNPGMEQPF